MLEYYIDIAITMSLIVTLASLLMSCAVVVDVMHCCRSGHHLTIESLSFSSQNKKKHLKIPCKKPQLDIPGFQVMWFQIGVTVESRHV